MATQLPTRERTHIFIRTHVGPGVGLTNFGTVMLAGRLENIPMFFERGCGQPDGIREGEAFSLGQKIGRFLRTEGITNYNLIDGTGESMDDNPRLWYSAELCYYQKGIDSVLSACA